MRTTATFGAAVVAAGTLVFTAPHLTAQERGEVGIALGETPELVEVEDLDGNPVSLADFVGEKPVLVEFWAYWCGDCEELHPELAAAHREFGDRMEFVAVGVGVNQTPRRMRRHLEEMDPPVEWTTLFDGRGRAARAFLAPTTSYIVILNTEGRVVYVDVGPDQNLTGAVRSVLAATEAGAR